MLTLSPHEQKVLAKADYFTAYAFHGRGNVDKVRCSSLESARRTAKRIYRGKTVLVYAVKGTHQALVDKYNPENAAMTDVFALITTAPKQIPSIAEFASSGGLQAAITTSVDVPGTHYAIRDQRDLLALSGADQVAVRNLLNPSNPVKIFQSKKAGAARIWELLRTAPAKRDTKPPSNDTEIDPADTGETNQETADMAKTTASKTATKGKGTPPKGKTAKGKTTGATKPPRVAKGAAPKPPKAPKVPGVPRPGTKKADLLALLQRKDGATMAEMLKLTGWKACLGTCGELAKAAGKTLQRYETKHENGGKTSSWRIE